MVILAGGVFERRGDVSVLEQYYIFAVRTS